MVGAGVTLPPGRAVEVGGTGRGVAVGGLGVGRGVAGSFSVGKTAGKDIVGSGTGVKVGATVGTEVAAGVVEVEVGTIARVGSGVATAGDVQVAVARPRSPNVYSQDEKRKSVRAQPIATFLRSFWVSNQFQRS